MVVVLQRVQLLLEKYVMLVEKVEQRKHGKLVVHSTLSVLEFQPKQEKMLIGVLVRMARQKLILGVRVVMNVLG
jgi:hypothetical protein